MHELLNIREFYVIDLRGSALRTWHGVGHVLSCFKAIK